MNAEHDPTAEQEAGELRDALRQLADESRVLGERLREQFKRLAGPRLGLMQESRQATESCLQDPDPNARCAALCLMTDLWGPDEGFARVCEGMAIDDASAEVRGVAVSCLGRIYAGTCEPSVARLVAGIVTNEAEATSVRQMAYRALFSLGGVTVTGHPPLLGFRFPQDVDWSFVRWLLEHVERS